MNILDAIIIVVLIIGVLGGLRRGLIKSLVLLIGLIAIIVVSYYLKNPVSAFFYQTLPFFPLKHVAPIFNIIIYEFIAFIIIFSLLYLVLRVLLHITGILEKILKLTVVLGFFSSIGGAILGLIESYILVFIALFFFSQPFMNITGVEDSKLSNTILDKTPFLAPAVKNTRDVVVELKDGLINKSDNYNKEAIDLFIKYDIISQENVDTLIEKGKLEYK